MILPCSHLVKRFDTFNRRMDDTSAAAATAATAAVRALSKVLQPALFQQLKLNLPTFWLQDPLGLFQHAKA
jgi:hypothetical protein